MRSVFFIPPLRSLSGGLAAILDLVSLLMELGRDTAVSAPDASTPGLRELDKSIARLPWPEPGLNSSDLWCVPESWPNALAPGLRSRSSLLVYVQNWVFMLSTLPSGTRWNQLPLRFLAVSRPVHCFLKEVFGLRAEGVLPPAVHPAFFAAASARPDPRQNTVRIAWMPRKNKGLALQIQNIALAVLHTEYGSAAPAAEFSALDGLALPEVAEKLAASHIFLSTGFPEGFALPPAEAMAAGCVPVGFSGLGGLEYMRNPTPEALPAALAAGLVTPPWPLPEKSWGANGLFVPDGDVLSAGRALAHAIALARAGDENWELWRRNGQKAAQAYSRAQRKEAAARLWPL